MMGVSKVKDLASKYVTVSTIAFNRLSLKFEPFPVDLNLSYLTFQSFDWLVGLMVFNATFNNFSVISWRSVLLVEETRVPGENHRPVASH